MHCPPRGHILSSPKLNCSPIQEPRLSRVLILPARRGLSVKRRWHLLKLEDAQYESYCDFYSNLGALRWSGI